MTLLISLLLLFSVHHAYFININLYNCSCEIYIIVVVIICIYSV
jgi:hypothetical protein